LKKKEKRRGEEGRGSTEKEGAIEVDGGLYGAKSVIKVESSRGYERKDEDFF